MLSLLISWGGAIRAFTILGFTSLELVGLLVTIGTIAYQIPQILMTIYNTWISPILGHHVDLRTMGKWAVVTGASDGVGKAYCEEMARLGVNIVLISRSQDKLERVARDIEERFKVETKIITVDFTDGFSVYEKIAKEIDGLEVGTLVNNIGMWYPYAEYFTKLPNGDKYVQDLIHCNIVPMTMMSKMVLPQMCDRQKGVIVNISSMSACGNIPLMSVYGAAKGYMDRLSQSLAFEYESQGIIIQSLLPAYVSTKMSRVSTPSWTSPSPTDYVQTALKTIGVQQRTAAHIPHRLAMRAIEWYSFMIPVASTRGSMSVSSQLRRMKKKKMKMLAKQQQEENQ